VNEQKGLSPATSISYKTGIIPQSNDVFVILLMLLCTNFIWLCKLDLWQCDLGGVWW